MKNNRKNRKLNYIREKNKIRCGMEIIHTFKHNDIYVGQSNYDVDISKLGLLKYRIPVKVNWFQVGLSEDDFISGLITVTVSISKK